MEPFHPTLMLLQSERIFIVQSSPFIISAPNFCLFCFQQIRGSWMFNLYRQSKTLSFYKSWLRLSLQQLAPDNWHLDNWGWPPNNWAPDSWHLTIWQLSTWRLRVQVDKITRLILKKLILWIAQSKIDWSHNKQPPDNLQPDNWPPDNWYQKTGAGNLTSGKLTTGHLTTGLQKTDNCHL